MAYQLVCKPDDAHAAANCRVLPNGRIQIVFIEKQSGEHDNIVPEVQAEMEKAVLAELAGNERFLKLKRAMRQLNEAQGELAAMDIERKTEALNREKERLANEMMPDAARKMQDCENRLGQLAKSADGVRDRIATLTPLIEIIRRDVEEVAKTISTAKMHEKYATLAESEIKTSAALSKAAGPSVRALANLKAARQMLARYSSPELGRFWTDQALAKS